MRTWSKTSTELWYCEWKNPLQRSVPLSNPREFIEALQSTIDEKDNEVKQLVMVFLRNFLSLISLADYRISIKLEPDL